jgi:hypothetical protein
MYVISISKNGYICWGKNTTYVKVCWGKNRTYVKEPHIIPLQHEQLKFELILTSNKAALANLRIFYV